MQRNGAVDPFQEPKLSSNRRASNDHVSCSSGDRLLRARLRLTPSRFVTACPLPVPAVFSPSTPPSGRPLGTSRRAPAEAPAMPHRPLRFASFLAPNLFDVYAFIVRRVGQRLGMAVELSVRADYAQ